MPRGMGIVRKSGGLLYRVITGCDVDGDVRHSVSDRQTSVEKWGLSADVSHVAYFLDFCPYTCASINRGASVVSELCNTSRGRWGVVSSYSRSYIGAGGVA